MGIREIVNRPSALGVIVGVIALALSLTPSLIPRTWVQQAVISALTFLCGYGIGEGLRSLWVYLGLPTFSPPNDRRASIALFVASGAILVFFMFRALAWQNNVREMVGLEPVSSAHPIQTVLLALLLSAVLLIVLRFLWWLGQLVATWISRAIPRRVGRVIGVALGIVVVVMLLNGVLFRTVSNALNTTYSLRDGENYDNVYPPTSPLRSGSPESLLAWETLGREGRRFVGTGPTADEISQFWGGAPALEPIRIYVGDKSAATLDERAELALQEMLRTGAFDRKALVLVTSTGNGWVDANSVNAVEFIYGGDTALVSFQYSYLPSVYALIADKSAATDASLAMFNKIQEHWRTLDPAARPEFYLHGLSLGAYGSQAAVSSVNQFNDPINGALWAGPPFVSEFWHRLTRDREAGTPIWLPIYQGGTTIRFTNTGDNLQENAGDWQDNRFVYLQQAGDPIVFFTVSSLYRMPDWLEEDQRSPKAPSQMRWYPVVTFWQLIFDMVLGTSDALPDGNGHRYASGAYIDSWVALAQPENWTAQQTEALKTLFLNSGNLNKP